MWLIALVMVTLGAAQAPASSLPDAQGSARVRGAVVRADDGVPVVRATVFLAGPGARRWEASTDETGRFEFAALPPGRYSLNARKPGYIARTTVSGTSLALDLVSGQTVDDVVVRLARGGAIEGRIVDDRGEPVVEAYVRALRAQYVLGGRRLSAAHAVQTNDLGAFRLYGLPPGRYFVVAGLRSLDLAAYDPEKPPTVTRGASGFAPNFFPGTALAVDAQPLIVRSGETLPGVDFTARPVRLARISGVVVDARGRPASEMAVLLNPARMGGAAVTSALSDLHFVQTSTDGSFVLSNVKPGEYRIDAWPRASIEAIAQSGGVGIRQSDEAEEYASVPVTVSGDDVDGLRIVTTGGHRVTGRLIVQGASATPDLLQRLKISTYDASAGPGISAVMLAAGTPIHSDGTFELRGVSGRRIVSVYGLPRGWALHSVRVAGRDVADEGIDVAGDDVTDVEVVITSTPSSIVGVVADASQRPVAGAGVIVFAADRALRASQPTRRIAAATTDATGSFEISTLPAGEYLVAVVEELVDGEWAEPDYLEALRATGVRIRLGEADRQVVTLRR
jgi:hypothetical protein